MNKLVGLSEADRAFKESIIKLNALSGQIVLLDNELSMLSAMRLRLWENLLYLKEDGVITALQEYRKIKEEYQEINAKANVVYSALETHKRSYKEAEEVAQKAKEALEDAQSNVYNNVVEFKKNGQK